MSEETEEEIIRDEDSVLGALFAEEDPDKKSEEEVEETKTEEKSEEKVEETKTEEKEETSKEDDEEIKPDEKGMVPHGALHATREKAKKRETELQAEIEELKAKQTQSPPPPPPPAPEQEQEEAQIPDPKEDPEGYAAYIDNVNEMRNLNHKLDISETFARKQHGDEKVDKALEWLTEVVAKETPDIYRRVISSKDPYEDMLSLHSRTVKANELADVDADDWAKYQAWKKAQSEVEDDKSQKDSASKDDKSDDKSKTTPPQSLASTTQDGGDTPKSDENVQPGVAFEGVFAD